MRRFVLIWGLSISAYLMTQTQAQPPMPRLLQSQDIQRHYTNTGEFNHSMLLSNTVEQFLGLMQPQTTANPQGGLLILHDTGQTADWPHQLKEARLFLPSKGWTTLAIDLPLPQLMSLGQIPADGTTNLPEQTFDNRVLERISTGVETLNNEGLFNIAIAGYGEGAYWAARYLSERLSEEEHQSYALILIDAPLKTPQLSEFIGNLPIALLDIYTNDSDSAQAAAKARKAAATIENNNGYLQIHDVLRPNTAQNKRLSLATRRLWGWLKTHAAGNKAVLGG